MTTERNLPPVLPQNANVAEENELEFEQLLDGGKIDDALALMDTRGAECMDVFTREYLVENHEINSREPKITQRRDGTIKGVTERARLPVPYQVYINEVAVVFLFGQPVQWQQQSDGTDEAFEKFLEVMKDARFDAKIRQCKRLAGAETECALLFRTYKDEDDKSPRLQLRILAASKHDEIYTRFDEYENLVAFAWGYHVKTKGNQTQRRVNVYTKADVYECAKGEDGGWQVTRTPNKAGKIPVILFRQEKEWAGVERLIKREEAIASGTADANDYFADPIMIMAADVAQSLPDKDEKAKTLLTSDTEGGVNNAAKYLTWDNAPQSKQQEITWLQEQILSKSFTPDIKLDTL
ncbi:MAG: phage portal protein, partial [Prevotellaceae bacterium]|nr:phage portal protein [Prevotellaceae bacterium]